MTAKLKPFLRQKGLLIFLIILILLTAFFLYKYYLKPEYQLNQFLPQNYQLSLEFKNDRLSLPKMQQKKLLDNPTIKDLYSKLNRDVKAVLNSLPPESAQLIQEANHFIFFWMTPEEYALILKIDNQKMAKNLVQAHFDNLHKTIIKDQVFILSNNQELLNNVKGQKIAPQSFSYFSLNISPWLNLRFNSEFLTTNYNNQLITDLQNILKPLSLGTGNSYQLELDSDSQRLSLLLTPEIKADNQLETDLDPYLNLLWLENEAIIALNNLDKLKEQLNHNQNLKQLWQKLDSYLWIGNQLSLSALVNNLQPPVVLSRQQSDWQIITHKNNKSLIEGYLISYLAQFKPREVEKILPDGTRVVEFKADTSQIKGQASQLNGFTINSYERNLSILEKGDQLILTNNQGNMDFGKPAINCTLANSNSLSTIIYLGTDLNWLKANDQISSFSNLSLMEAGDGTIKACLEL